MTANEAIETLKLMQAQVEWDYPMDYAAAIDEAIEAMRKQIPNELGLKVLDYLGRARPECGNCGEAIEDAMWDYCPWCGQRIGDK